MTVDILNALTARVAKRGSRLLLVLGSNNAKQGEKEMTTDIQDTTHVCGHGSRGHRDDQAPVMCGRCGIPKLVLHHVSDTCPLGGPAIKLVCGGDHAKSVRRQAYQAGWKKTTAKAGETSPSSLADSPKCKVWAKVLPGESGRVKVCACGAGAVDFEIRTSRP